MEKTYCVYILASDSGTLYVGVTSDLQKRIFQHKNGRIEGFTKEYNCHKLVHFEVATDVWSALEREKQIKKWRREKKEWLIRQGNAKWKDLSSGLGF